ncbi:dihydroorotate dehydrogenase electron transfer subunit [Chloroflexota bacterium]
MKQIVASVISNSEIMPGVCLIWLESPRITSKAQPGQFVMVRCGEDFECLLRRPLSIHQMADGNKLAFLFNVVGKGTYWLAQCRVGDNIDLLGPLGNGYSIHAESHKLLLVSGGIGIAPLYFLAKQILNQGFTVRLLLGASTVVQLYPRHLLPPETESIISTEDGTAGKNGMITDFLPDSVDWADQIFACGPLSMYKTMTQMPKLKNKLVQVSLEMRMGCGCGVCYGCTVKTKNGLKQVCKDGPVFELDEVLWDGLVY